MIGPSIVLVLVVLGFFLPCAAWLSRKVPALVEGRVLPDRIELSTARMFGLLRPIADVVKAAAKSDTRGYDHSGTSRFGVAAGFVGATSLFALLPFGGAYSFGVGTVQLTLSDLPGSLLVLVAGATATAWVAAGSLKVSGRSVFSLAAAAAWTLIVAGTAIAFGSTRLAAIAAAQDRVIRIADALPPLPAWGIVLQPIGCLLFVAVALTVCRLFGSYVPDGRSGPYGELTRATRLLWRPLIAAWIVTLYMGAWSVPYADQAHIIEAASFLGTGLGTAICAVIHVSAFVAKTLVVMSAFFVAEAVLPAPRSTPFFGRVELAVIPLAFLNALGTAWWVSSA